MFDSLIYGTGLSRSSKRSDINAKMSSGAICSQNKVTLISQMAALDGHMNATSSPVEKSHMCAICGPHVGLMRDITGRYYQYKLELAVMWHSSGMPHEMSGHV